MQAVKVGKDDAVISSVVDNAFIKTMLEKEAVVPTQYDKRALQKEYVNRYRFRTEASKCISYALVLEAEKTVDRANGIEELLKYVEEPHIAIEMEKGLFEFSLIHVNVTGGPNHFIENVYKFQLNNLCRNLDPNDAGVENKTLFPMIWRDGFDPYIVPFLPPEQLHPMRWLGVIKKRDLQDDVVNGLQTTDMDTCKKCKAKRFKMLELQLRCIDESSSKIYTCTICYYTFII